MNAGSNLSAVMASNLTGLMDNFIILVLGTAYGLIYLTAIILLAGGRRRQGALRLLTFLCWAGLPLTLLTGMINLRGVNDTEQLRPGDFGLTGIVILVALAVFVTRLLAGSTTGNPPR